MSKVKLLQALLDADVLDSVFTEEFFPDGYTTAPLGDKGNNAGVVEMMSDSRVALFEKIVNGIDAVTRYHLDNKLLPKLPKTPNEAQVAVAVVADTKAQPQVCLFVHQHCAKLCVTIADQGTGVLAEDMAGTILNVLGDNKVLDKLSIGTYGIGGSAAQNFCKFSIVISRSYERPDEIAFTAVFPHYMDGWKRDSYHYLVDGDTNNVFVVTLAEIAAEAPHLLGKTLSDVQVSNCNKLLSETLPLPNYGLIVRMVDYNLKGTNKTILYNFLRERGFGMELPVRYVDYRETPVEAESQDEGDDDAKGRKKWWNVRGLRVVLTERPTTQRGLPLLYASPIERHILADGIGSVRLSAWVLDSGKSGEKPVKMMTTNASQGIFVTLNDQTHATIPTLVLLKHADLEWLQGHLIMEVRLDDLPDRRKGKCLASTRDRLKDEYDVAIKQVILSYLKSDRRLRELNDQLMNRAIAGRSDSFEVKNVVRSIAKLLRNPLAGGVFSSFGGAFAYTQSASKKKKPSDPPVAIEILDVPDEIRVFKNTIERNAAREIVRYVMPTTNQFGPYVSMKLPSFLSEVGMREFRDGRGGFYVACDPKTKEESGELQIVVNVPPKTLSAVPKGFHLASAPITIKVIDEREEPEDNKTRKGLPEFTITEVKGSHHVNWQNMDVPDGMEANNVAFSYKYSEGKMILFWNSKFAPFEKMMISLGRTFNEAARESLKSDYIAGLVLSALAFAESTFEVTLEAPSFHNVKAQSARVVVAMVLRHLDEMKRGKTLISETA